jgi:hypothetical protein
MRMRWMRHGRDDNIASYSLKVKIAESQQPVVTRQRPVNNEEWRFLRSTCRWLTRNNRIRHAIAKQQLHGNRGTMFSKRSV